MSGQHQFFHCKNRSHSGNCIWRLCSCCCWSSQICITIWFHHSVLISQIQKISSDTCSQSVNVFNISNARRLSCIVLSRISPLNFPTSRFMTLKICFLPNALVLNNNDFLQARNRYPVIPPGVKPHDHSRLQHRAWSERWRIIWFYPQTKWQLEASKRPGKKSEMQLTWHLWHPS